MSKNMNLAILGRILFTLTLCAESATPQDLAYSFQYPVVPNEAIRTDEREELSWQVYQDFQETRPERMRYRGHLGEDWNYCRTVAGDCYNERRPIVSIANGIVVKSGVRWDWAGYVMVKHYLPNGDYVISTYGHLQPEGLPAQDTVFAKGQLIGYTATEAEMEANTTDTGPHLHFELRGSKAKTGQEDTFLDDAYELNHVGYFNPTRVFSDNHPEGQAFIDRRFAELRMATPIRNSGDYLEVQIQNSSAHDFSGRLAISVYTPSGEWLYTLDDVPNDEGAGAGGGGQQSLFIAAGALRTLRFHHPFALPVAAESEFQLRLNLLRENLDAEWWGLVNPEGLVNPVPAAIESHCGTELACLRLSPFRDVPARSWYVQDVISLQTLGVIRGKSPGQYVPNGKVARSEFLKMVTSVLELRLENDEQMPTGTVPSANVLIGQWFYEYLEKAYGHINSEVQEPLGIWSSSQISSPLSFWAGEVSRQEAARILGNAVHLARMPESCALDGVPRPRHCRRYLRFSDVVFSSTQARWIYPVQEKRLICGMDDGSFQPHRTLNRAEAARMVSSLRRFLEGERLFCS